jgi:hypothetical protein
VLYANVAPRQDEDRPREDNAGERLHGCRRGVLEGKLGEANPADRVERWHRDRCQLCLGQQQRKTLANFSEGEVALHPRANER